jgi:hypothetical protein
MPIFIALLLLFAPISSQAGELSALGGIMWNAATDESSHSWQLEYSQCLGEYLALSLSYLNEGHVPDHHRDGHSFSIWGRTPLIDQSILFSAGLGSYFYYDTAAAGKSYRNNHGWGAIGSLATTIYLNKGYMLEWRANYVETFDSIDTFSTLLGIGWVIDSQPTGNTILNEATITRNELTIYGGQTIANSFGSEQSFASQIEFRREIMEHIDWSIAWLYEGDNRLIRRNGINSQLWGTVHHLEQRMEIGAGAGAYFAVDHQKEKSGNPQGHTRSIAAIVTLTAAYRAHPKINLRGSWSRIVTNYDRDTDVILGGVGYLF